MQQERWCSTIQSNTFADRTMPLPQIRPGAIELHPDELALVVHYEVCQPDSSRSVAVLGLQWHLACLLHAGGCSRGMIHLQVGRLSRRC